MEILAKRLLIALALPFAAHFGQAMAAPAQAGPANDAAAQALAAALRQLDLRAPTPDVEMPRLRYHARIVPERDGGGRIELARYNLGDAVRREAIAEYGTGQVDAPKAFGVGPHVAWRFELSHKAADAPVPATPAPWRIGKSQAASNRCGAQPCLALYDSAGLAAWRPLPPAPPTPSDAISADEEPPAQITLALLSLLESRDTGNRALELVIDLNLGNDAGSEALLFRDGCLLRRRATASGGSVWATYDVAGTAGCPPAAAR